MFLGLEVNSSYKREHTSIDFHIKHLFVWKGRKIVSVMESFSNSRFVHIRDLDKKKKKPDGMQI